MQASHCPHCGRPIPARATRCEYCGVRFQPSGQRTPARPSSPFASAHPSNPQRPPAGSANPATARARPPTRQPGRLTLKQRPDVSAPPGGPGKAAVPTPAPRKYNPRLILLLAALVGVIIGGTIGFLAFARKGESSANNPATPTSGGNTGPIVGKVSFTASGGLQGKFSISLPETATPASFIQKGARANVLEVVVNNATMNFELTLSPYPGPGSYTLQSAQTNPAPGSFNGVVRIGTQQNSWSLHSPAHCSVTVASETPLTIQAQNKPLREVKGSFACPELTGSGSAKPIKVTQGQFDVYAEVQGA